MYYLWQYCYCYSYCWTAGVNKVTGTVSNIKEIYCYWGGCIIIIYIIHVHTCTFLYLPLIHMYNQLVLYPYENVDDADAQNVWPRGRYMYMYIHVHVYRLYPVHSGYNLYLHVYHEKMVLCNRMPTKQCLLLFFRIKDSELLVIFIFSCWSHNLFDKCLE